MSTAVQLQSEKVVIDAPMSFTGSAKRLGGSTRPLPGGIIIAVPLILLAWVAVAAWYVVAVVLFGVLLIPWRLLLHTTSGSTGCGRLPKPSAEDPNWSSPSATRKPPGPTPDDHCGLESAGIEVLGVIPRGTRTRLQPDRGWCRW